MGREILVVDDDISIRTALKLRLERDAFIVHTASDGDDALTQIDRLMPDLVILDLALPRRDGLDVLAQLKAESTTASIPVIILTARYQSRDDYPGFLSLAAEVITKPFSPRYVARRVHELLTAGDGGPAYPPKAHDNIQRRAADAPAPADAQT